MDMRICKRFLRKDDMSMMTFAEKIAREPVGNGELAVFWAGQAGFIFKTGRGKLIAADLYLSDCCRRYAGFKRLLPRLMGPYDAEFDVVVATHSHYDHFDVDAMPMLLENGRTRFFGAYDTKSELERLGLKERLEFMRPGDSFEAEGVKITAVRCDHGELAPDAVGIILEAEGKKVYMTGDTCFRPDYFSDGIFSGTDLLILPINGAFGNMNEAEAAKCAEIIAPGLTVPCHFWNFAEHGGDPCRFAAEMKERGAYEIMRPGEGLKI